MLVKLMGFDKAFQNLTASNFNYYGLLEKKIINKSTFVFVHQKKDMLR